MANLIFEQLSEESLFDCAGLGGEDGRLEFTCCGDATFADTDEGRRRFGELEARRDELRAAREAEAARLKGVLEGSQPPRTVYECAVAGMFGPLLPR